MIKKLSLFLTMIAITLSFSNCVNNECKINNEQNRQNDLKQYDITTWENIGKELKDLLESDKKNEIVMTVNDIKVTYQETETQKIYNKHLANSDLKSNIKNLISDKTIVSEARKVGIKPVQEEIDEYLKQTQESLYSNAEGTETILSLIKGMDITIEEYLNLLKESVYDMFLRNEFQKTMMSTLKNQNYAQYIEELEKKADIEIFDDEIRKLLDDN